MSDPNRKQKALRRQHLPEMLGYNYSVCSTPRGRESEAGLETPLSSSLVLDLLHMESSEAADTRVLLRSHSGPNFWLQLNFPCAAVGTQSFQPYDTAELICLWLLLHGIQFPGLHRLCLCSLSCCTGGWQPT